MRLISWTLQSGREHLEPVCIVFLTILRAICYSRCKGEYIGPWGQTERASQDLDEFTTSWGSNKTLYSVKKRPLIKMLYSEFKWRHQSNTNIVYWSKNQPLKESAGWRLGKTSPPGQAPWCFWSGNVGGGPPQLLQVPYYAAHTILLNNVGWQYFFKPKNGLAIMS